MGFESVVSSTQRGDVVGAGGSATAVGDDVVLVAAPGAALAVGEDAVEVAELGLLTEPVGDLVGLVVDVVVER